MKNPTISLDTPPCGQSLFSNPMKKTKNTMFSVLNGFSKLACTLVAGSFITTQAHSAMLLQYNFSEGTGTTSANSGTVTGATATFSGGAGFSAANNAPSGAGFSMNNSDSTMGARGATVTDASLNDSLDNLTSMTLTGWYKADGVLNAPNNPRLFNKAANTIGTGEFAFYASDVSQLRLQLGATSFDAPNSLYNQTTEWVFFAVTYTGGSGGAFYAGDQDTAVTGTAGTYATSIANIGSNTLPLVLGNRSQTADRPFDGFLDDMRVYNEALNLSQIEGIRASAIPEPSGLALLGCSAMGLLLRRRR